MKFISPQTTNKKIECALPELMRTSIRRWSRTTDGHPSGNRIAQRWHRQKRTERRRRPLHALVDRIELIVRIQTESTVQLWEKHTRSTAFASAVRVHTVVDVGDVTLTAHHHHTERTGRNAPNDRAARLPLAVSAVRCTARAAPVSPASGPALSARQPDMSGAAVRPAIRPSELGAKSYAHQAHHAMGQDEGDAFVGRPIQRCCRIQMIAQKLRSHWLERRLRSTWSACMPCDSSRHWAATIPSLAYATSRTQQRRLVRARTLIVLIRGNKFNYLLGKEVAGRGWQESKGALCQWSR